MSGAASRRLTFDAAAVAVLTALAAALRFATLDEQSFWYDEAITLDLVQATFAQMLAGVHNGEATPPLYFILAWGWTQLFGDGEVGLRSLSALAGTLTVPVAYLAARELIDRRVGLILAVLVTVSPALVYYSQEARSYALLVLLCAVALLFFGRALREPSWANHVAWAIASALALVTHYFAFFVLVPMALWLLVRGEIRARAAAAVGGLAAAGLALAPLALYQSEHGGADWIATYPLVGRVGTAAIFLTTGLPDGSRLLAIGAFLLVVGAVVLVWRRGDERYRNGTMLALGIGAAAIVIPLAAAVAGSDYVLDRNLLPAWLPLAIVLAAGLAALPWRSATLVLLAGMCAVSLGYDLKLFNDYGVARDDWRALVRELGPAPPEGRVIAIVPVWQARPLANYAALDVMSAPRRVGEVDTIVYDGPTHSGSRGATPVPGPPFRPVETTTVHRMTITRYRAGRPATVEPAELTSRGRPPLLQTAGG